MVALKRDIAELIPYFDDVKGAGAPPTADEEAALARALESSRCEVWEHLLGHPPIARHIIERLRPTRSRAAFRRALDARDRVALERTKRKLANVAWNDDRDCILLNELLGEVDVDHVRGLRPALAAAARARNELARRNLRLVVAVARRYRHSPLGFADAIQEGNLGLLKAIDRFEVQRGFRLSTYASWWIRHHIVRAIADRGRLVRHPVHRVEALARLGKAKRNLGSDASAEQLAVATGMKLAAVQDAMIPAFTVQLSLDRPEGPDFDRPLEESLVDPESEVEDIATRLVHDEDQARVRTAMERLPALSREVLRARFGFDDPNDDGETLEAIGKRHDLSRERIRQIQDAALKKLRVLLVELAA